MVALLKPRSGIVTPRGFRKPANPVLDPTHPINRGLVGCWPLNETYVAFGSPVAELTGRWPAAFSVTGPTAPAIDAGHHGGTAFKTVYSGTNSGPSVRTNSTGICSLVSGIPIVSAAMWMNKADLIDTKSMGCTDGVPSRGWDIAMRSTGLQIEAWDTAGTAFLPAFGGSFTAGLWYLIGFTWKTGGNFIGYINGVPVVTTAAAATNNIGLATQPLTIGGKAWDAEGLSATYDMARVWNREITPTEMKLMYAEPYAGIYDKSLSFAPGPYIPTTGYQTLEKTLSNTVVTMTSDSGNKLESYFLYNPDPAKVAYVQVFDKYPASSVVLGTTPPKWSMGIPPGSGANLSDLHMGPWANAIQIAATSTSNGSSAPSTPVVVNFGWR